MNTRILLLGATLTLSSIANADIITKSFTLSDLTYTHSQGPENGSLDGIDLTGNHTGILSVNTSLPPQMTDSVLRLTDTGFEGHAFSAFDHMFSPIEFSVDPTGQFTAYQSRDGFWDSSSSYIYNTHSLYSSDTSVTKKNQLSVTFYKMVSGVRTIRIDENGIRTEFDENLSIGVSLLNTDILESAPTFSEPHLPEFFTLEQIMDQLNSINMEVRAHVQVDRAIYRYDGDEQLGRYEFETLRRSYKGTGRIFTPTASVPEPATLTLFLAGLIAIARLSRNCW